MKFIKYSCEEYEDVVALYSEDTSELIMCGDLYDDEVMGVRIEGFLRGLNI